MGLFLLVINTVLMMLTSWIAGQLGLGWTVSGRVAALRGALLVSVVSFVRHAFFGSKGREAAAPATGGGARSRSGGSDARPPGTAPAQPSTRRPTRPPSTRARRAETPSSSHSRCVGGRPLRRQSSWSCAMGRHRWSNGWVGSASTSFGLEVLGPQPLPEQLGRVGVQVLGLEVLGPPAAAGCRA